MPLTLEGAYRLDTQVALRPEPFGALAYHYGNRRLTFLRSPDMVKVVEGLDQAGSVAEALKRAGITPKRWPSFVKALTELEASEVIRAR
jgi:putative mycofactocin binding protein MftB